MLGNEKRELYDIKFINDLKLVSNGHLIKKLLNLYEVASICSSAINLG